MTPCACAHPLSSQLLAGRLQERWKLRRSCLPLRSANTRKGGATPARLSPRVNLVKRDYTGRRRSLERLRLLRRLRLRPWGSVFICPALRRPCVEGLLEGLFIY